MILCLIKTPTWPIERWEQTTIEEIVSPENLNQAMAHVMNKRDSCGVDGMMLSELPDYLRLNRTSFLDSIRTGTYEPRMVRETEILSRRGKTRYISKLASLDRFILRAIYQVLYRKISPMFAPCSFAFQEHKGILDAARQTRRYIMDGDRYVVEIDIQDYFDHIDHRLLLEKLKKAIDDPIVVILIKRFLRCQMIREFTMTQKTVGLVQGSPLSPLLSNFYLIDFDRQMEKQALHFYRFADDLRFFVRDFPKGIHLLQRVSQLLTKTLHLSVNRSKCGVFQAIKRRYLGYQLIPSKRGIEIRKFRRERQQHYPNWHTTSIRQQADGRFHLLDGGILTRKDFSILFENEEKKQHIPVEVTDTLNVYSSITFSADFFRFADRNRLQIGFFDRYGRYIGCFLPAHASASAKTALAQAAIYNNPSLRLKIAKLIDSAGVHNFLANLKYYNKRLKKSELSEAIKSINQLIHQMKASHAIDRLMMLEARARQIYFSCFNLILDHDGFTFVARTRRPPKDPINALISYGNAVLYRWIACEIYKSTLDIRISFLHSAKRRNENLNLDLSELFKPVIVDRIIFTLINRQMISVTKDFETTPAKGVLIKTECRKLFLSMMQQKMYKKITVSGRQTTYRQVIRDEITKLLRFIMSKEPYRPYLYY